MGKLRFAKRTNPQVFFHRCKSSFVNLCGSIRDWSFLSTILQAVKEITQKPCTQGLCREAISYVITPKKWKFLGLCACDFNFVKPPALSIPPSSLCG